jgi:antitoxin component HigA of HigAB toxin-antitoxin module
MPIQDEDAYNAALGEAESLMEAKPDTPEGARLAAVVQAIETYEARVWPISFNSSAKKR